jgi:hypothetical protein
MLPAFQRSAFPLAGSAAGGTATAGPGRPSFSVRSSRKLSTMHASRTLEWDAVYATARLEYQQSHASPDSFGTRGDIISLFSNWSSPAARIAAATQLLL